MSSHLDRDVGDAPEDREAEHLGPAPRTHPREHVLDDVREPRGFLAAPRRDALGARDPARDAHALVDEREAEERDADRHRRPDEHAAEHVAVARVPATAAR